MKIWERLRAAWPGWPGRDSVANKTAESGPTRHLELARESLAELLQDRRVPDSVRAGLTEEYQEVEQMLERLEHGELHIAAFGRVSVGKSALLNALLGHQRFSVSPLHGETKVAQGARWQEYRDSGVLLMDTPGINEIDGEQRGRLAREVAGRADLLLFVLDGDITQTELDALRDLVSQHRPLLLVLNKVDRYSRAEREELLAAIEQRTQGLLPPRNLLTASANPAPRLVLRVDADGNESETEVRPPPDVTRLKERLWEIIEAEGKTLAALNASLFAGQLSDKVAARLLEARQEIGQRVIRAWCIGKGVAVALNPVPVADLAAALIVDVSMVVHLSKVFALPMSRSEAGSLIKTIAAQMALLMGSIWVVNVLSSALKLGSGGLSTLVTGAAQGGVAYYATYVVGQAALRFLAQGKSWGELGPKLAVREILDSLDRDSIMEQARSDIRARLRGVS